VSPTKKTQAVPFILLSLVAASTVGAWELVPSVSYGNAFLDPAPNAYSDKEPESTTYASFFAKIEAEFGRWGASFAYTQRYEAYPELGKVNDHELVIKGAPFFGESYAVYVVGGVGVARPPAVHAFYFVDGPAYEWTPVVGTSVVYDVASWFVIDAGATYRVRPQVTYFGLPDLYGAVTSPAIDLTLDGFFRVHDLLWVGPSISHTFYGPYDYYSASQTNRNEGWLTGNESFVMFTVACPINL
jgi:hypothetical protein